MDDCIDLTDSQHDEDNNLQPPPPPPKPQDDNEKSTPKSRREKRQRLSGEAMGGDNEDDAICLPMCLNPTRDVHPILYSTNNCNDLIHNMWFQNIVDNGAFLLEDGNDMFLFLAKDIHPQFLSDVHL